MCQEKRNKLRLIKLFQKYYWAYQDTLNICCGPCKVPWYRGIEVNEQFSKTHLLLLHETFRGLVHSIRDIFSIKKANESLLSNSLCIIQ